MVHDWVLSVMRFLTNDNSISFAMLCNISHSKYGPLFCISTLVNEIIPWQLLLHHNFRGFAYEHMCLIWSMQIIWDMKYLVFVDFYSCKQDINMFHEVIFLVKFDLMYFLTFRWMQFLEESLLLPRNWPIIIQGMVCALPSGNWA